jgi:hypothetical protein
MGINFGLKMEKENRDVLFFHFQVLQKNNPSCGGEAIDI